MIRELTIRRFKRFEEETFDLQGHVVLAGPNNLGKTTILQAIAAWSLALTRWKQLGDFQRHGGQYPWAPIARQAFLPVPLANFEWLWHERQYRGDVEIDLTSAAGWRVCMQLRADSTEQIYVRPRADAEPDTVRAAEVLSTYVPPMSGLSIGEPVYTRAKQDQLLGQGRPGEIIRNLLLEASQCGAWEPLAEAVRRLFRCELLVPDGSGADIVCEYRPEAFAADPHEPPPIVESFLRSTKARESILPPILTEAGIHGLEYTRYSDIAVVMTRDEVHPEVIDKLDHIQQALGL